MTPNLTVRQRIYAGFAVVLAVLVCELAVALSGLARIQAIREQLADVIEPRERTARALERSLLYRAIAARNVVASGEAKHQAAYERGVDEGRALLRRLTELDLDAESAASLPAITAAWTAHMELATRFLSLHADPGTPAAALTAAEARLAGAREALLAQVRGFVALQERETERVRAAATALGNEVRFALLACAALVAIVLAATAALTTRAVRRPAARLVAAARALERGERSRATALAAGDDGHGGVRRGDELGELAVSFGRMAVALAGREDRLAAEGRLATALARSLAVEDVARAGLEEIVRYTGAELGAVYVLSRDGAELERAAAWNQGTMPDRVAAAEGVMGEAVRARRTVLVAGIPRTTPFALHLGFETRSPESVAAVPISFGDEPVGVLLLGSLHPFNAESLPFAERTAAALAVSIQNALAHARARALAEELQRSNEQLQAQNEELQAQGEELQTQSEELQAQGEELQAQALELGRRTDELRGHRDALETVDRRKNEFLATLGHELRNPLAAITSAAQVLLARRPAEGGVRHAAVVARQAEQLRRLVDDLLDVARIDHGKIELRPALLDLRAVIHRALEGSRPALEAKGHQVTAALPEVALPVQGDATRLEQVLSNLLHNAARYTPERGRISIDAGRSEGRILVRVRDDGVGMSRELLSRAFEPFTQGGSSSGAEQGLGLGLALVRRLVTLHGGTVEARSAGPGAGSEFVVELPESSDAAALGEPPEELPPPPRGAADRALRVLVVDDNPDVAETLGDLLEYFGYEVRVEGDAAGGLRAALELHPDLALLDLSMPGMDGFELARELRRCLPAEAPTRLVAITGHGTADVRERTRAAGFDLHLVKPVGALELRDALERLAGGAEVGAAA